MKKVLLIVGLLFATSAVAELDPFSVYNINTPEGCIDKPAQKDELTLPELVQIGICNNPKLNRSYMSVKTSEANLGKTKSAYLPSVTATGSISKTYKKIEEQKSGNAYPYSGNIALSWLIYDFGGRSAKTEQMKAYLDSAEFSYNAALHDTVLAIHQAYFDLLSAQEVLRGNKENEKSYKKSYEEAKRRFDLGLVSSSDKLLAKTTYEESSLTVVKGKNSLKKAQGALAVLLNLPPDTELKVAKPPKDKDVTKLETNDTVQQMIETALELRPELKGKKSDLTAAEREIEIAKAAGLPSLTAGASAGFGDSWKDHNPYEKEAKVGLNLTVPLFTGFSDMYNIARAKYAYRQAALSVIETTDSVRKDVWDCYQDYISSSESYRISKTMRDSANENHRVAFASYKIGKGSILELLTANAQMATANRAVVVAYYNLLTNKANLYRAIGRF